MRSRFQLQLGDITQMNVEAIVNSSDETLLSGGPVHTAVHQAAGPGLQTECEGLGGCPVGGACITRGYRLPVSHVIHTVAPTWQGGDHGEEEALASCYRNSLLLATSRNLQSIAFPSLGSGRQPQIPLERAAPLTVRTILEYLDTHAVPDTVLLVCYDGLSYQAYQNALKEALP